MNRGKRVHAKYPRIRRDLKRLGLGLMQITSKAQTARLYAQHVSIIDGLINDSQVGVLRSLKEKRTTLEQLTEAKRQNGLTGSGILTGVAIREPLWASIEATIPKMGKSLETRKRYRQSASALKKRASVYLGERATVGDLQAVNWIQLQAGWNRSGSDWMHLRRFISAFLSKYLGDVYHPYRRQVVTRIPTADENERVPEISPELFWKIIDASPEYVRPAFLTIVLTGMRRAEYLRCTREHLQPATLSVRIPGSKTKGSRGTVRIAEEMWPWIDSGIPSPLRYKRLRARWVEACRAVGVSDLHLHDLRHALGQWATDAGMPESKVQDALRHASPLMTRRYTRQKSRGEVATAVSGMLKRKGQNA